MKELETSRINEINRLHNEIVGHLKTSLEKAMRIGELLTEQKQKLKHGEFTPWIKANLPFTDRTARNYMRLHRERDRIKTETVSDLKSAYKLLEIPGQPKVLENYDELEDWEPNWNPVEWRQVIKNINDYIGNKRHFISDDEDWFINFNNQEGNDDGSMTLDEQKGLALRMNLTHHACYYQQYAWHKGIKNLPRKLKSYFRSIEIDLELYTRTQPKTLYENCCGCFPG